MRQFSYLAVLSVAGVFAYSAFAQQAGDSRQVIDIPRVFAAPGPAAQMLAQAPAQNQGTVTTTTDPARPQLEAQAQPPASPTAAAVPVDETALRYFARQGDTARVEAEIERLRALYPNWEPPTNLLSDDYVPDADIIRIWELFSAGDFAGARAAIATKQQADPAWTPSADLLQSLDLAEAGIRLRNASDATQYETVISTAANFPALLTCERIDNLWRLAEAFARTDVPARAVDAYVYVLENCADTEERFATMQKAIAELGRDDLDKLFDLERVADGTGEFEALRLDLARTAIAASLEEDGPSANRDDVERLEAAAEDSDNAEDLRLLGWYQLSQDEPDEARDWFERAFAEDPSPESAQGLGVALLDLDEPEAAEVVLADFWEQSDEFERLYLDAAAALLALEPRIDLDEDVLERIVEAVTAARHAQAAQELGWYAYAFQQPRTAVEWFTLALRWQSDLEAAAYGMMVASNALGDLATVESIRAQWGGTSARIANFGRATMAPGAQQLLTAPPLPLPRPAHVARYPAPQPAPVVTPAVAVVQTQPAPVAGSSSRGCTSYVPPGSLSAAAALSHGWCLMDLDRPAQAVDHFARALQSGSQSVRSDAAYGQSLAFVRLGLADEAAIAAAAAPITNRQAVELEVAILSEKAVSAYGVGDYRLALDALDARARLAAERNDLLTMRAWSYYHLRRYREAQRIFEAVAATGYGDAVAGLDATNARLMSN
jgi:tetratricopeptide (TPR) repeat protein